MVKKINNIETNSLKKSGLKPNPLGPYYLPAERLYRSDLSALYRVNQAGELGAVTIYAGQGRALRHDLATASELKHMGEQEQKHFQEFNRLIAQYQTRPSFFYPLWRRLGYAIGFTTAKFGKATAMGLTVGVEDEINEHYLEQLAKLERNSQLYQKIEEFRLEELEHRDLALDAGAKTMPLYQPFYQAVRRFARLAINIAKRF